MTGRRDQTLHGELLGRVVESLAGGGVKALGAAAAAPAAAGVSRQRVWRYLGSGPQAAAAAAEYLFTMDHSRVSDAVRQVVRSYDAEGALADPRPSSSASSR